MKVLQSGRVKLYAFLAIGIVGGSLAAGPLPPAFGKVFQGQLHVQPNIVFTGNQSGPTLKSINNGTGSAITAQAVGGPGIFGQSVTGGGIVGSSTSGYGLTGTSASNIGLNGSSTTNDGVGGSTHTDYPFAGVFGTSVSPDSNAVGVAGEQGANGYGTVGTCNTGPTGFCVALTGQTLGTNGESITAFSFNSSPAPSYTPAPEVMIQQAGGGPVMQINVIATSPPVFTMDGNGTIRTTTGNNAAGIVTDVGGAGGDSIDAFTLAGAAGEAQLGQANGTGVDALGFAAAGGPPALLATDFGGANAIIAHDSFGCSCDIMSLDPGGNMILLGGLTTFGVPLIRVKSSTGHTVSTYSPQQTEPTIEDFGQGQLVNGEAAVRLDPAFANTMDMRKSYLVFITPDGDSRGLYTTQKTAGGFVVRENGGGRSTLAFDYRIVAKPFGNNSPRLPSAPSAITPNRSVQIDVQRALYSKTHPNLPHGIRLQLPLVRHH